MGGRRRRRSALHLGLAKLSLDLSSGREGLTLGGSHAGLDEEDDGNDDQNPAHEKVSLEAQEVVFMSVTYQVKAPRAAQAAMEPPYASRVWLRP